MTVRIGVVAFQGAWREHLRLLERLGAEGFPLRSGPLPEDLAGVVLPGGESTVIGRHLAASGLSAALAAGIDAGLPALGTCAGAILLARRLEGPAPEGRIPRVPFLVRRNAWGGGAPQSGTQRDSFEGVLSWNDGKSSRGVFIRAPRFDEPEEGVTVLARFGEEPVALRWRNLFVAAFHPELDGGGPLHFLFLDACRRFGNSAAVPRRA